MLAGGVAAGVENARQAVGALPAQGNFAVDSVKGDAPMHQAGYGLRPFAGQSLHRRPVAQPGPGGQSVLQMQSRRIPGADGRRNAALGVAGIAVVHPPFGQDQSSAIFPGQQSGIQPGNATANDDVIVIALRHKRSIRCPHFQPGHTPSRQKVSATIPA